MIDVSELVRLWPVISGVSDVTPPTLQSPPLKNGTLERDVELLREMLDVTKAERDSWKSLAQKVTALMENQSAKKRFLGAACRKLTVESGHSQNCAQWYVRARKAKFSAYEVTSFQGVLPRPTQVHYSPEWPPVSLVPLSLGHDVEHILVSAITIFPQHRSCHEKRTTTRAYVILRDGTFKARYPYIK